MSRRVTVSFTPRQRDLLISAAKTGLQQGIWHTLQVQSIEDAIRVLAEGKESHPIRREETR